MHSWFVDSMLRDRLCMFFLSEQRYAKVFDVNMLTSFGLQLTGHHFLHDAGLQLLFQSLGVVS